MQRALLCADAGAALAILVGVPRQLLIAPLLCSCLALAQAPPPATAPLASLPELTKGAVTERVLCAQKPEQSYALYLPSNYSPARRWPIVYSFDPAARGAVPVRLQQAAAESLGYILAASNNSRNGPWKLESEAAQAMVDDTRARLAVDDQAMYFAGFSGGARLASQIATLCKCAAGVLLSGAGFSANAPPNPTPNFAVFSAVGTLDFNYEEVIPLQEQLEQTGHPRWLYVFEGGHDWVPAEGMAYALAWFRLQAMRANHLPKDVAFVAAQFARASQLADATAASGDALSAWREDRQIAATFDGLTEANAVSAIRAKAEALGKSKSVREALVRESESFAEQARLEGDVLGSLATAPDGSDSGEEPVKSVEQKARALRLLAEQEKHPEHARVYHRAIAGVFVGAMENGSSALDRHDYRPAARAFACATEAAPDSEWAWRNLALTNGLLGNRKASLAALRRVRELSPDKAAFAQWISRELAFQSLRLLPDFRALVQPD